MAASKGKRETLNLFMGNADFTGAWGGGCSQFLFPHAFRNEIWPLVSIDDLLHFRNKIETESIPTTLFHLKRKIDYSASSVHRQHQRYINLRRQAP